MKLYIYKNTFNPIIEKHYKRYKLCIHFYDFNYIYELLYLINNTYEINDIAFYDGYRRLQQISLFVDNETFCINIEIKRNKYHSDYCYITRFILQNANIYRGFDAYDNINDIEKLKNKIFSNIKKLNIQNHRYRYHG